MYRLTTYRHHIDISSSIYWGSVCVLHTYGVSRAIVLALVWPSHQVFITKVISLSLQFTKNRSDYLFHNKIYYFYTLLSNIGKQYTSWWKYVRIERPLCKASNKIWMVQWNHYLVIFQTRNFREQRNPHVKNTIQNI